MGLFATIEREPHRVDRQVLSRLATEFNSKNHSRPELTPTVVIFGYLTQAAADDLQKQEIEAGVLERGITYVSRSLSQLGIPADRIFLNDHSYSATKARKIDLFLVQRGESVSYPPNAPLVRSRSKHLDLSPSAGKKAIKINSQQELSLEVTAFKVKSGQRTVLADLTLKSITGISPSEIKTKFNAEFGIWKTKLSGVLQKLGQQGLADKIELSFKLVGGGEKAKEFGQQVWATISASLKSVLTLKTTVPGTSHELTIELSLSYGVSYRADTDHVFDGNVAVKGKGMVEVVLFRF